MFGVSSDAYLAAGERMTCVDWILIVKMLEYSVVTVYHLFCIFATLYLTQHRT